MPTLPIRRSLALVLAAALAATAAAAARGSAAAQGPGDEPAPQAGHDMSSMPGLAGNGAAPGTPPAPGTAAMPGMPGMAGMPGAGAADGAMAHEHMDMGPHMKMTALRPRAAGDQRRADAIAQTLRGAIARYRDYRVAVADGFVQYLPNVPQPIYHFTHYGYAYQAEFAFDPARPTSLLYKPVPGGFELVGAMYTAPRRFDEGRLDERVPLSVAAWHEHVNICLPPKSGYATADWRRFGFKGTIATASECQASGGTFHPVIFNWMVHVYPFEQDPAKVWAH
jgi:hypothetical protein